jgi:hypothetical protein
MKSVLTAIIVPVLLGAANNVVAAPVEDPVPDTYVQLFDLGGNVIVSNDNGSTLGNGWASGFQGIDAASGFANNGDGTFSLRIGVTGRPDGLDGVFNGLFQNVPHGQFGPFMLVVEFFDAMGTPTTTESYFSKFPTGAEAVLINYGVPAGSVSANINIKNNFPFVCQPFDLNFDPVIDTTDLGILISSFGDTPAPTPAPDTVMVLVDKTTAPIATDDNSSLLGDGFASGLFGVDTTNGIVTNGDGTFTLRTLVTGAADALDGEYNGLAGNSPHGELGRFTVFVDYFDAGGLPAGSDSRSAEFATGAEAFFLNFDLPPEAVTANVHIDNTVGSAPLMADLNEDYAVDTADLGILIGVFGDVCLP